MFQDRTSVRATGSLPNHLHTDSYCSMCLWYPMEGHDESAKKSRLGEQKGHKMSTNDSLLFSTNRHTGINNLLIYLRILIRTEQNPPYQQYLCVACDCYRVKVYHYNLAWLTTGCRSCHARPRPFLQDFVLPWAHGTLRCWLEVWPCAYNFTWPVPVIRDRHSVN